jgi:hypothetical protein
MRSPASAAKALRRGVPAGLLPEDAKPGQDISLGKFSVLARWHISWLASGRKPGKNNLPPVRATGYVPHSVDLPRTETMRESWCFMKNMSATEFNPAAAQLGGIACRATSGCASVLREQPPGVTMTETQPPST